MLSGDGSSEGSRSAERRLLVIDDDADVRDAMVDLFRDAGYEVMQARNGREALLLLDECTRTRTFPDLVLLDLMMPVMDGWQFRLEQKRNPYLAAIPVVALSANASPQAEAIDAEAFIPKPFDAERLLSTVAEVLRAAERRKIEAAKAQADRLASIGLLAAGVAHEINNPLAYVLANLEFVSGEVRELANVIPRERYDVVRDALDDMDNGLKRVHRIVRSLSVFSRVEEEHKNSVDLPVVLDQAIEMASNEINHRGTLIKTYGHVPKVYADSARLAQVFINLLVNAAQALDESKASTNRVAVMAMTAPDGWAVIEVRDSGQGIPAANLTRIFDPFFSTKPIGSGSGLGLSICHGIVAALGGRIEVESELGKGSVFRVLLPPGRPIRPPPIEEAEERPRESRGRVLVIDDERLILTTIRRTLSTLHDVETAATGEEALRRIEAGEEFDVLLCDLMMPGMGGIELFERLKTAAPKMIPRFAFLTGGAFTPRARTFLESADVPWLEKPFELRDLARFVDDMVAKSRSI